MKNPMESMSYTDASDVESFKNRLKNVINGEGVRAFARRCGLSEGALRSYLSGETYPTLDRLEQIADAVGVSPMWLAYGLDRQAESPQADLSSFALVPLYDVTVSAGHGLLNSSESKLADLAFTRYWLHKVGLQPGQLAAIRVKGDSMEPTIRSGDTLLVDLASTQVQDGQVFVIRDGDTLLVKRLQLRVGGSVQVISDNRLYPEYQADLAAMQVVGRVVWKGSLV